MEGEGEHKNGNGNGNGNDQKTTQNFPPFTGVEGKLFSSERQPSGEAKSNGWKERRAERLLTQMILSKMAEGSNLKEYVESLVKNAKKGNSKAIETVNKGIEDDIVKIEHSGDMGITWKEIKVYETESKADKST